MPQAAQTCQGYDKADNGCCVAGDVAFRILQRMQQKSSLPSGKVTVLDINEGMLAEGKKRAASRQLSGVGTARGAQVTARSASIILHASTALVLCTQCLQGTVRHAAHSAPPSACAGVVHAPAIDT